MHCISTENYPDELDEELSSDMIFDNLCLLVYETKNVRWIIRYEFALSSDQALIVISIKLLFIQVNAVLNKLSNKFLVVLNKERHNLFDLTL